MANITTPPYVVRDAVITFGSDNFQASIKSARLVPTSSSTVEKGMTPSAVYTLTSSASWTLELEFFQGYDSTDLTVKLFNEEGEEETFVVEPIAGGAGFSGTVILTPAAIGGAVDQTAVSSVTLGVQGKPSFTAGS